MKLNPKPLNRNKEFISLYYPDEKINSLNIQIDITNGDLDLLKSRFEWSLEIIVKRLLKALIKSNLTQIPDKF